MNFRRLDKRFHLKSVNNLTTVLMKRISLICFIFLSLFLIVADQLNDNFRAFFSVPLMNIVKPVIELTNGVSKYSKNLVSSASEIIDLRKNNIILKQDNELLKLYYQKARDLEAENIQLRKLLNFIGQRSYKYVSAKVISVNITSFSKLAIINIGSKQNIKKGQVVVNNDGLVGRIIEVGNNSSKILLITDIKSRIPVYTFNSRQRAILVGNNSNKMTLSYLSNPLRVNLNEFIMTSEDGGYFPSGMPVGIIEKKSDKQVIVSPKVDLPNIDYVSIIIGEN